MMKNSRLKRFKNLNCPDRIQELRDRTSNDLSLWRQHRDKGDRNSEGASWQTGDAAVVDEDAQ